MKEKIALLNLSEAEEAKLPKFMASLTFVTVSEIQAIIDFLSSKGVTITLAHETTIFANPLEELKRKFSILEEVHVSDIYKQTPLMLNKNAIEIYKKVNYCIQNNVLYKKEDGTYEGFLFSERDWQQKFNRDSENVIKMSSSSNLDQTLITLEPVVEQAEPTVMSIESSDTEVKEPSQDDKYMDIQDFMNSENAEESSSETISFATLENSVNKMHDELDKIDIQTSNLATERKTLEEYVKLNDFKDTIAMELNDDFVSFGDIEPDFYGVESAA